MKPGEEAPETSAEEASATKVYTSEQFWDKVAREEERDLQVVLNRCELKTDCRALTSASRLKIFRMDDSFEGNHVWSSNEPELQRFIDGWIAKECRVCREENGQVVECQGQSIDVQGVAVEAD